MLDIVAMKESKPIHAAQRRQSLSTLSLDPHGNAFVEAVGSKTSRLPCIERPRIPRSVIRLGDEDAGTLTHSRTADTKIAILVNRFHASHGIQLRARR